jgi:transposase InsO family protein
LHPDTGSEFLNWHLKDWCDQENIELTRSRPSHKNDNAYVEERNGHVIRKWLGYNRLDVSTLVPLVNELYIILETYLNHFVPSRKCLEKTRIGSRYHRRYDRAATPYLRVLTHPSIEEDVKELLRLKHTQLNPLYLKKQADLLITKIFTLQRQTGNPLIV